MKKIIYIVLGLLIGYYLVNNFPIKSWEEFNSYIYSGKKENSENTQKNQENNDNNKKIDLSHEEKKKQLNEILGIQEEEKPKTFKDKVREKYEEIKQKIENVLNSIKIFFTKQNEKGE